MATLLPDTDYATLTDVRTRAKMLSTDTGDDGLLKIYLRNATIWISTTFRTFAPVYQTLLYDALGKRVNATCLDTEADLLEVITLTNGDSVAVTSGQYFLVPANIYPKWRIQLKASSGLMWTYATDWQQAISVSAYWGYHEGYALAFVDTLEDVPLGGITSSATSITLTDVDGSDAKGFTRFEVGSLIRMENELVKVTDVNTTTNVLTLARGVNGTAGTAHLAGVGISRFDVQGDVREACADLVVYLYRNRDTVGDVYKFLEGVRTSTNTTLSSIAGILSRYQRGVGESI